MKNKEILTEDEIREIKEMTRDARRQFGMRNLLKNGGDDNG